MMLVIKLAGGCLRRVKNKTTSNRAIPKKVPPTTSRIFVLRSMFWPLAVARLSLAGAVALAFTTGVVAVGATAGVGAGAGTGTV